MTKEKRKTVRLFEPTFYDLLEAELPPYPGDTPTFDETRVDLALLQEALRRSFAPVIAFLADENKPTQVLKTKPVKSGKNKRSKKKRKKEVSNRRRDKDRPENCVEWTHFYKSLTFHRTATSNGDRLQVISSISRRKK